MTEAGRTGLCAAAGALWGAGLIWLGATRVELPIFSLLPTLAFAFLAPGLVLLAVIGWRALRTQTSPTHAAVLRDTVEQLTLALALWPASAYLLAADGPGVAACLGLGFALARAVYWTGAHLSETLRALGWWASFAPTVLALVWSGLHWAT